MAKSKTAAYEVPVLTIAADEPAGFVVTVPNSSVAALPVGPVDPVEPVAPLGNTKFKV
jgi:hypothetical protein